MSVMDALEAVYKADPATAESMIDDIVLDTLADEVLDNAPLLNRMSSAVVSQKVAIAKRALLRQYASEVSQGRYPDEEVHKTAEWLTGIEAFAFEVVSKDSEFERKHKRGFGGRFVRGVSQTRAVDPEARAPEKRAAPVKQKLTGNTTMAGLGAQEQERLKRTQAQYEQANEILAEFGGAFSAAERAQIDAIIQYKDAGGDVKMLAVPLEQAAGGLPDTVYDQLGLESDILSVQVDPGANADARLMQRVNNFNAAGAQGGSAFAALMNMDESKRTALTSAYMPRRPEQSRLSTLFGRMKAGGDVLEATGNPKMAEMARFMGSYGPEAERVLDPHVRQAAYRYRGTEKEPDILLMRQMNSPDMNMVEAVARDGVTGDAAEKVMQQPVRGATPISGSTQFRIEQGRRDENFENPTEDQFNMRVRSDVAAMHLMRTIPLDRRVAELSRKSGNILPSQGVLIDADGDVVSQAVGMGDDTYLPFDYANMKRSMRGGQYVRTRVQGGLTGEDIAAAVGNGARMATVVSSSGVHSIEFDPNLRGARAKSDKPREMYRRYIQILDAVEGSGMYAQDLDPREKAKLRQQAEEISGEYEGPNFENAYRKLEGKARAEATRLTSEEIDGLMAQAEGEVEQDARLARLSPERKQKVINDKYKELEEKASSEKVNRLRLNAEGYQVALQTLQQQFPYYIRNVSYEPLADDGSTKGFLNSRGMQPTAGSLRQRLRSTDEGYVRPGGIKAASTQTGFYATQGEHQNKREAMEARNAGAGIGGGGGGTTPPSGPGLTGPTGGPEGGLMGSVSRLRNQATLQRNQNLTELQNVFTTLGAQRVSLRNHPAGQQWDQVKDLDNQHVAAWFLNQENPRAALEDASKSGRLATALSDRKAVASAFNIALQSGAGPDFFAGGGEFGGRKDAQSAADYVADLAMKVVDADLVTQPFVNPQTPEGDPFHAGQRPQALKINGVSVNNVTNGAQLNAFLKQNPDVADLARKLGTVEGGDGYKPAAAVAQDVSERVAVLRDLGDIISAAKKDPDRATGLKRGAGLYVGEKTANPQKFMETLTRMNDGRPVTSAEDLIALERKWPDAKREAMKHQQAWALVNAGRAVGMVEGGDVGGGPKAAGRLQKSLEAAADLLGVSTRPARPVLERVSKDASPLAREISRRRLAGLAFIPEKV